CGRDVLIPGALDAIPVVAAAGSRDEGEALDIDHELGPSKTSGKAIASLILGITSLVCSIFTGIPALILGIISLVQIHRSHGRMQGQGLAIGGIVTGAIGSLLIGPAILVAL